MQYKSDVVLQYIYSLQPQTRALSEAMYSVQMPTLSDQIMLTILGVLASTAILPRMVPLDDNGQPLGLADSFAVVSLANACALGTLVVGALMFYSVVTLFVVVI